MFGNTKQLSKETALLSICCQCCGGCCNNIDDPYTRVCVSNNVKNMNVRVLNFMSRLLSSRLLIQHNSCECKFTLNKNVFYLKQRWNHTKC